MSKLDDVNWHTGGDSFPAGVPPENGATHIGFFVAWAVTRGHWGHLLPSSADASLQRLREGQLSGRRFVLDECDGKLLTEMFSAEAVPFVDKYYTSRYLKDYRQQLTGGLASDYLVEDTPQNFTRIAALIDERHEAWKKPPWWKVW